MPGDIFISYARKDDQAAKEVLGSKGLVSSLHDRLLAKFEELGAPRPTIFRDTKQIEAADQFEARLRQGVIAAKLLVVVLSRNWLESAWCRRELDTFVQHRQSLGESESTIKERIVVLRKHAVPSADCPSWLQGQSGYDLMKVDPENDEEIEYFDSDLGRPRDERWFTRIGELAKLLRKRVHDPSGRAQGSAPPDVAPASLRLQAPGPLTIYVARPAADMERSYATLVEELEGRGVRVVPDGTEALPIHGDRAVAAIDAALSKASLSIHLLGDKPGFQPEGAEPIVRLQLARAVAKLVASAALGPSEPQGFHRLIWAPRVLPESTDGTPVRDPFKVLSTHSSTVEVDPSEDALRPGDKLDGDTFTKFIQFVLQQLEEIARPSASRFPGIDGAAQIYVQHDEQDAAVAETVAEELVRLGFAPLLPVLEGDSAGRLQVHRDALLTADAVVLCWAKAAAVWVRASAAEIRRWQDLGRAGPFATRTIVALPPLLPDKARMRKFPPRHDVDSIIDATAIPAVTPDALDQFLRPLRAGTP